MARKPRKPGVYCGKPLTGLDETVTNRGQIAVDTHQDQISFQKETRGKTQLKYFGLGNVFCDFLFKRVAPEG